MRPHCGEFVARHLEGDIPHHRRGAVAGTQVLDLKRESDALYAQWAIPAPGKPLFEAAAANFNPHSPAKVDTGNSGRGPLLLVMGGHDHTVPEAITKATLKQYRHSGATTDIVEFADRAHSLTIDHGWRDVADATLTWLTAQGL